MITRLISLTTQYTTLLNAPCSHSVTRWQSILYCQPHYKWEARNSLCKPYSFAPKNSSLFVPNLLPSTWWGEVILVGILRVLPQHNVRSERVMRGLYIADAVIKLMKKATPVTSNVPIRIHDCFPHPSMASNSQVTFANRARDIN